MKEEVITTEKKEEKEGEASRFKVKDKRFWAAEEKGEESPAEEKLPTYVEQLQKQAEESEKKLKEYIAAYKQKMAENDEFRKRLEINYQKRAEQINADFLLNLIPVVDNLERAISSAEKGNDFNSLLQGIKMTQILFLNQLKNSGVEKIEVSGKPFNPENEEAVEVIEVNEKDKDNIVIEELEKGYKIKFLFVRKLSILLNLLSTKNYFSIK